MGSNSNTDGNNNSSADPLQSEDKHTKRTLLIDTIAKECASSSNEVLQQIYHAINVSGDGSKLEATVLSGGYTNYSYKVYVDKHPELCAFAKLCFEYALWNPDKEAHYDLKRTENEYEIMKKISGQTPHHCVVEPLACWDVLHEGQRMKLLVTEWSKGDEQFCNQFIDGEVDPRIAPKIAETLSSLHIITGFDPSFNELVKPCMMGMLEHMKSVARTASTNPNPVDRTEAYCASLGEDTVMNIIDGNIANYHQRDCLIHSDSHVFNLLVEAKPSVEKLEAFGRDGILVLCDWEMAMAGPIGRDIGLALAFPIGCMIAHAFNGHSKANKSIETYVNTLIDTYLKYMTEAGKNKEELASILRNIAGWCGWFQYLAFYVLDVQNDFFPLESKENVPRVRDALGILGMKLLRLAYDTKHVDASTAGLEESRKLFNSLWEEEVTRARYAFASRNQRMQPRKSSMLRAANRRLSDTEMLYLAAESVKRMSISEDAQNAKQSSIGEDVANGEDLTIEQ